MTQRSGPTALITGVAGQDGIYLARHPARRRLMAALAVYSALLAVALLAPTSGSQSTMASWVADLGVWIGLAPETASQARAEIVCNAAILAPISALGSLIWPGTSWRDWTAYAFVIGVGVELTQGLLLPHRTASHVDIVANTLGGLLGAAAVAVARRGWSRPGPSES